MEAYWGVAEDQSGIFKYLFLSVEDHHGVIGGSPWSQRGYTHGGGWPWRIRFLPLAGNWRNQLLKFDFLLRDCIMRFLTLGFSLIYIFQACYWDSGKSLLFFSKIRKVVRILSRLPGVGNTAESTRLSKVRFFLNKDLLSVTTHGWV
jgi:hypothetical protein